MFVREGRAHDIDKIVPVNRNSDYGKEYHGRLLRYLKWIVTHKTQKLHP